MQCYTYLQVHYVLILISYTPRPWPLAPLLRPGECKTKKVQNALWGPRDLVSALHSLCTLRYIWIRYLQYHLVNQIQSDRTSKCSLGCASRMAAPCSFAKGMHASRFSHVFKREAVTGFAMLSDSLIFFPSFVWVCDSNCLQNGILGLLKWPGTSLRTKCSSAPARFSGSKTSS